jgi:hypothetical protein
MEAVNERNGGFLGDFRLDMLANGSGPENAETLPLSFAVLVGLDGSHQQVVSTCRQEYFSSIVLEAIDDINNSINQHI